MKYDGIIIKGICGFYYVEAAEQIFECKARGIFRKTGFKPLAGDRVKISVEGENTGTIDEIKERKTELQRPAVANIDQLFILSSVCEPSPNILIIDKMIAIAESKGIEPVVVITKADLASSAEIAEIYNVAGITTVCTSSANKEGSSQIRAMLENHLSAFAGNTGVGKSTLLNSISPGLKLKTGEISEKLGRGRHTTREVELFKVGGGYVADTPGFSSLDIETAGEIMKNDLPNVFREFRPFLGTCKFSTCTHTKDKGCKILEAVSKGEIHQSRHDSYVAIYEEIKNLHEWERR